MQKTKLNLREKALAMLARREHSELEIRRKLGAYATSEDDVTAFGNEIDNIITDFKKRGWLSQERFTEQVLHARKRKFGSVRIAHELRENGIEPHVVEEAIATLKSDELSNAKEIWRKKFKASPTSRDEWAKQARFLQSRGFSFDVIKKVLNDNIEEFE